MPIELFFCFFFAIQGLIVGSFLNVFIERSPHGKSLSGRSTCDGCSRKLVAYELIPVFSYLWQKGRSACCKKPLSIQYPIIESLTGVLFFSLTYVYLNNMVGDITIVDILSLIGLLIVLTATIAIVVTDFRSHLIPDTQQFALLLGVVMYLIATYGHGFSELLIGVIILICLYIFSEKVAQLNKKALIVLTVTTLIAGTLASLYVFRGVLSAEVTHVSARVIFQMSAFATTHTFILRMCEGMVTSYPILLMYLLTKGRGMGYGDVKLQFLLGMFLGLGLGLTGLYMGFVLGAFYGAVLMLVKRANRKTHIAFGPFLLFGAWIAFFWGENILQILRSYF